MHVVVKRRRLFKVSAVGNYDARPQGGAHKLIGTIGMNLAHAKRIIGIAMHNDLRAAREV
jgi:hypothetical protein